MKERRAVLAGAAAVITVLLLLFYVLPRQRQMGQMEKDIEELKSARSAVTKLLPEAAEQANPVAPNVTNLSGWLATHAITGMEKRVAKNDPSNQGRGCELEIHSLKPSEVSVFLVQLTQIRLLVKSYKISDFNARGVWDLRLSLELPAAAPNASPTPSASPVAP